MAERVCPVWIGYLLASPIRKLFQNPEKILAPFVENGMKVLDIGPGMGFFSLPMARMVGADGKVICVDMQEGMLKSLQKRARKANMPDRIETRVCRQDSLGLEDLADSIDFALAFAVVHELPDASGFFSQVYMTLKQKGRLLVSEPKGHVSPDDFKRCIAVAEKSGLKIVERPGIARSRSVIFEK